jgi:hypothetical protein
MEGRGKGWILGPHLPAPVLLLLLLVLPSLFVLLAQALTHGVHTRAQVAHGCGRAAEGWPLSVGLAHSRTHSTPESAPRDGDDDTETDGGARAE